MGHTALILGDQLMRDNPALEGAERVVFVESLGGPQRLRTHRKRVHLVLSAMRHFAAELRDAGEVEVVERRGVANIAAGLEDLKDVVCAEPNSAAARRGMGRLGVRQIPSNQFLTAPEDFASWAAGRKRIVMEDFYREQRRRFGVLMAEGGGEPEGGRWNFDRENRRPPPSEGFDAPDPWRPQEDAIDEEVRSDLDAMDLGLFGEDGPRRFAATPAEARAVLDDFVSERLPLFGPWQDAMGEGLGDARVLFHSLLSAPLNLGLIDPLTVVHAAEVAYRGGAAPLASVEGFVRQIIGWREYVWGMYWVRQDQWPHDNALAAGLDLPDAFWGQRTGWACLDATVDGVAADAYAHHIERLMILGNIGLTAGVEPWQMVRWFQSAFIDGAEWVMAPNAAGMALHADGGVMMTKPYAAGGNYINKMSGHCKGCRFSPNVRTGPDACPVTALYWDFMARNRERFAGNHRMRMPLNGLARFSADERAGIADRAREALRELQEGEPGATPAR